jgi:subtilisin family serine protease
METRMSKLDSGLYELKIENASDHLLISEGNSYLKTIVPVEEADTKSLSVDPEEHRLMRAAAFEDSTTVSLKLIVTPGTEEQVANIISAYGAEITSIGRQVIVAEVPYDKLDELEGVEEIRRAEEAVRLQVNLIDARGDATLLDAALEVRPDLNGTDVVVGVIDTGIDWSHPDFVKDDKSRLELFIHSHYDETSRRHLHEEFGQAQIDEARQNPSQMPQGDPNGHGTHCASIAAGNGAAGANADYRGVATNATLVGVRSDGLFDTHIINGIRRIFELASDRPAVINLSLGGHWGPHDGTSAIENVIAQESGPGRIIVVAAGNEGSDRIHFGAKVGQGETIEIPFTIRDTVQRLNVWVPRGDEVSFEIVDHNGDVTIPNGELQETNAGAFRADLRQDPINLDFNFILAVASRQRGRRWALRIHGDEIINGSIHAWGLTDNPNLGRNIFMTAGARSHSIGMPATEERAITVGSFVSRESFLRGGEPQQGVIAGALSSFSSRGPTRSGAQKPDICAPGEFVGAALSSNSEIANNARYANRRFESDRYVSIQGTSMATPFVTGVIALMLQMEPNLTPEEIRKIMRVTARRDAQTGGVWNPDFGYGKLDAEALISYLEKNLA